MCIVLLYILIRSWQHLNRFIPTLEPTKITYYPTIERTGTILELLEYNTTLPTSVTPTILMSTELSPNNNKHS